MWGWANACPHIQFSAVLIPGADSTAIHAEKENCHDEFET